MYTHMYRKQEYMLLTTICIMMLVLAGMGNVCVCVCVHHVSVATVLLQLLWLLLVACSSPLQATNTERNKSITCHCCRGLTTHLSTGCTLYTKVHVHADCAWRPVLFVHILDDLRTCGLPSGQSNHTAKDSSHK